MTRVCSFLRSLVGLSMATAAVGFCVESTARAQASSAQQAQQPQQAQPQLAQQAQQAPAAAAAPTPPRQTAAGTAAEASPIKVTPYGTIYFNLFDNSAGTNNADVPLWATPGTASLSASARQTRFGLRLTGLTAAQAKVTAVVEADFYGGFPSVGVGDNMGVVRLRLANVRLDWHNTSVVVGQDWMVFAPGNPVSIAAAGIPAMAATGNAWARLPQVRVEWHNSAVLLQGAVLAPSTGDFSSAFLDQPVSGQLSQVPFLQGRAALTSSDWRGLKRPASIGVSGQYGRARVVTTTFDRTVDSRGVALDWNVPLVSRVTLAGEAFSGRNLAGFQAGVFQGVNPDSASGAPPAIVDGGPRAIETRGGWTQVAAAVNPSLTVLATYGLDNPRDDLLKSVSRRDWRLRNTAVAFAFIHKLSPNLSWGIEDRRIATQFALTGRHTTNHVNLAATFTF